MKKLLLALLGVLIALPTLARDFEYEGIIYTVINEDAKTCKTKDGVVDGNGYATPGNFASVELVIPERAIDEYGDSYSVTSIGYVGFSFSSYMSNVTIPNSVTSIGDYAFYECRDLEQVIIPNSVISIGNYAFYSCSGLKQVIIGNSVTFIGDGAFDFCRRLEKSAYPNTLRNPFPYGKAIAYNPDGALIEDYWIYGPDKSEIRFAPYNLGGEYIIPETVTSIGARAFYSCSGLKRVIIPNSVTSIGASAFEGCNGLTSVTIPNSVISIGASAFVGCSGLTSVRIPNSVTSIADDAFSGCSGLTSVRIPNSVTSIGARAFYSCSGLEWVTIPNSVTSIGRLAFEGCSRLTQVKVLSDLPPQMSSSAFEGLYETVKLEVPAGAVYNYMLTAWAQFKNIYREGSDEILATYNDGVLNYMLMPAADGYERKIAVVMPGDYSGDITIPERFAYTNPQGETERYYVEGLGYDAFYNSSISSVSFNPRIELKNIGDYAFYGCANLSAIEIPSTVESIGYGAFEYCKGLSKLTLHEGLKTIDSWSFAHCDKLTDLEVPSTVESIGYSAFADCPGLSSVSLLDGINTIEFGDEVFNNTNNVKDFYLGRPYETMGTEFMFPTSNLETLTIANIVTELSPSVCKDAGKLKTLTLSNSLTSIADNAFSGCKALKEVVIPPSVETIGASAFEGGSELASIIMGHKVKTIGENAFNGCPAKTVSITAQTPPSAPNNTFSDYSGKLYLQGKAAVDAYYDAFTCWDRFSGYVMIEPTEMKYEGKDMYEAKPGDRFQLTARLMPEDVTLPQIFWRSTNPEIATVDCNGLVTIHADLNEVMSRSGEDVRSCKIIAESLYADGPVVEVTITDTSGIDSVENDGPDNGEFDPYAPFEVYNLHGMMVATSTDNLAPGFYIVRQGNLVKKIAVK